MKAQERHELRENDLAGWLQYGLWTFIKQNGSYVLLVVALGFLGYQVWHLYSTRQENARLLAWSEYNNLPHKDDLPSYVFMTAANAKDTDAQKRAESAVDMAKDRPARLQEIIEGHDIKPLKAACYLNLGDFYHKLVLLPDLGIMQSMKLSREEALQKSAEAYRGAAAAMPDDAFIAAQAHLGIAAADEDQGEWDKAKDEYKLLTAGDYVNTPFAELAADRLATMDDRRKAPRLAAMSFAPPQPAVSPILPEGLGLPSGLGVPPGLNLNGITGAGVSPSTQGDSFKDMMKQFGPGAPGAPVTTSPASGAAGSPTNFGALNVPPFPSAPTAPATQP